MAALGVFDSEQRVAQAQHAQIAPVVHRRFVDLEAMAQSQSVSVGIQEFDKIAYLSLGALFLGAAAPINV